MNVDQRKMKSKNFQLFENGKLNTGWPIGYNLLLGYVNIDYPSKKVDVYLPDMRLMFK